MRGAHRRVVLIALAAGGMALSAQAQQPTIIPPLEVVATRRPQATHEVPASIEVITGASLRARGVTSLRDALALAAGVAIAPGGDGGPAAAVPEFWGLREFDAFLLVVDGIPWGGAFNPALATLNLRDVERIEVLRGPAAVTYGATSFVGVIHVVHNAAAAKLRTLAAHGGSYGTFGAAADLPIGSGGPWVSRLSGDFDRGAFKDDRTEFSRGHALWRAGKSDGARNTFFLADATVLRQDPASPHPRQGASLSSAVPLDANHNPANAYINETRLVGSVGIQRPMKGAIWGGMLSFTHSSQRMFRGFLTDISNDPDNASGFKETIDINDLYADTHWFIPAGTKVRLMAGADLLFAKGEAKGATFTYSAPLNGATAPSVTEPTTLDKDAEDQRIFAGAYGSVEWRPSERLSLNAGIRGNATSEKRGEGESVSHNRISGDIGAMVGIWESGGDHFRAFANFRSTFKPAAFDFGLAENEGVLEPETSNSYEAGLKLRAMKGKWDFEGSVFRMDFKNLVTSTVVNNLPALINSGETRFQGFELATDLLLPRSLVARATYSFHDGKFTDFVQAFDGVPTQLAGKRFEMSARHLASAGLTLAPELGLIAHVSANYSGDRYLNKRNTALVPKFVTWDAGIGYRIARAEFRVDGRNLGNRRDAVSESEFGDAQYYRMTARVFQAGIVLQY